MSDLDLPQHIPSAVRVRAEEMYDRVKGQPDRVGDSASIEGWSLETHTLGCRRAADDPEDSIWDRHWNIHDEYANDGISIVAGDPSDGTFITLTPQRRRRS